MKVVVTGYRRGRMLFLGLGTGLASAMILEGIIQPVERAHLPCKKCTFENYIGIRGLTRFGRKKWRRFVADVAPMLAAALEPDEVVWGGGNVKKLKKLPAGCRAAENDNAFLGGFCLSEKVGAPSVSARAKSSRSNEKQCCPR